MIIHTIMKMMYVCMVIDKNAALMRWSNQEMYVKKANMKHYKGRVPTCGIFCGDCPNYVRERKNCCGAETNCKIRKCVIYKCSVEKKGLRFCSECKTFPCVRFKKFAETWLKLGQNLIENQALLKEVGVKNFLQHFNSALTGKKELQIGEES